MHAALSLVLVLAGAAAQYLLLAAEFVAVTQVLVYVGAVMVLFLFGVMLTRAKLGREGDLNNKNWALGIPVALLMLGVMSCVLIDGFEDDQAAAGRRRRCRIARPSATASSSRTCCRSGRCRSCCSPPSSAPSSWPGRTDAMLINEFLLLGAVLFCIGVYGVIARKNAVHGADVASS